MSYQPQYHDDPVKCVCFNWARVIPAPGELLTHHKTCPMYDAEKVKETEKALRDTAWQQTNDR